LGTLDDMKCVPAKWCVWRDCHPLTVIGFRKLTVAFSLKCIILADDRDPSVAQHVPLSQRSGAIARSRDLGFRSIGTRTISQNFVPSAVRGGGVTLAELNASATRSMPSIALQLISRVLGLGKHREAVLVLYDVNLSFSEERRIDRAAVREYWEPVREFGFC
jgi:hypothetical protein